MNLIVILLIIENFIRIKISYILHQNDLFSRYINSFFILSHNFLLPRSTIFFFISSFLFSFLFSPFPFDILPFRPLLASSQDLYPISFLFSLSVSFFPFNIIVSFFSFLFLSRMFTISLTFSSSPSTIISFSSFFFSLSTVPHLKSSVRTSFLSSRVYKPSKHALVFSHARVRWMCSRIVPIQQLR